MGRLRGWLAAEIGNRASALSLLCRKRKLGSVTQRSGVCPWKLNYLKMLALGVHLGFVYLPNVLCSFNWLQNGLWENRNCSTRALAMSTNIDNNNWTRNSQINQCEKPASSSIRGAFAQRTSDLSTRTSSWQTGRQKNKVNIRLRMFATNSNPKMEEKQKRQREQQQGGQQKNFDSFLIHCCSLDAKTCFHIHRASSICVISTPPVSDSSSHSIPVDPHPDDAASNIHSYLAVQIQSNQPKYLVKL